MVGKLWSEWIVVQLGQQPDPCACLTGWQQQRRKVRMLRCACQSPFDESLRMLCHLFHGFAGALVCLQLRKTATFPAMRVKNSSRQERAPDRFIESGRA